MERFDGSVLSINAICADLGQKCLHLLCMHALSGCDTTSNPYDKGNATALNTKVSGFYQCLAITDDIDTTHSELINAAMPSFIHYSQPPVTSLESAFYNIFTKKKRNLGDGFTSNICKSSATHALGSSSNQFVESSGL